jgi:hypothetical protein
MAKKKIIKKKPKKAKIVAPAKKKVAPKKVKKVKAVKEPKSKGYRKLKDGSIRVYGWSIVNSPADKFPDMVSIEHVAKRIKKKFISMDFAIKYIELQESEKLIVSGGKSVLAELKSLGLGLAATDLATNDSASSKVTPDAHSHFKITTNLAEDVKTLEEAVEMSDND